LTTGKIADLIERPGHKQGRMERVDAEKMGQKGRLFIR